MPNFCPHCGTAVSDANSELCVNCGKPLNAIPYNPKNELLNDSKDKLFNLAKNVKDFSVKASEDLRSDETKAKIKDFANQAQSFASEKTKDLKEELEKINEARKATANEAKDFESTSKLENSKAVASSFWSKLSSKQKSIFIGLPVFLFVCLMALFEESNSSSSKNLVACMRPSFMMFENCQKFNYNGKLNSENIIYGVEVVEIYAKDHGPRKSLVFGISPKHTNTQVLKALENLCGEELKNKYDKGVYGDFLTKNFGYGNGCRVSIQANSQQTGVGYWGNIAYTK